MSLVQQAVPLSVEKIEFFSPYGQKLSVDVDAPTNGIYVKSIDGLDPTKSNIVTTSFSRQAGTQRQASRRESRNLKIQLGFDPNFGAGSVGLIRRSLYAFFMTGMQVTARFYTEDGLVLDLFGEVEEFDSDRMVQEPDALVSIYCFDPDFVSTTPKLVPGATVTGSQRSILDYEGTVDTGFLFKMTAPRAYSSFTFTNIPADGVPRIMQFAAPMAAGDRLEISSIADQKGAYRYRNGVRTSVLQGISAFSDWLTLFPGENRLTVQLGGAAVPYTIDYTAKFGGI